MKTLVFFKLATKAFIYRYIFIFILLYFYIYYIVLYLHLCTHFQDVHIKLNPGLPWQKQHST